MRLCYNRQSKMKKIGGAYDMAENKTEIILNSAEELVYSNPQK